MIQNPSVVLIQGDDRQIDLNLGVAYTGCSEIVVSVITDEFVRKQYKKTNTDQYKVFPNTDTGFENWGIIRLYSADTGSYPADSMLKLQLELDITDTDFPDGSRKETQVITVGKVGKRYA